MPAAISAAMSSGRCTAARAANVAPNENPATKVLRPNRSRSSSSSDTASETMRATLISCSSGFPRSGAEDSPVPRWSQ